MSGDARSTGRAVVLGLGRFGGGAGAARRLAREGWDVLVTDRRDAEALAPTLAELEGLPLAYALGGHRAADLERADLVVVNPAVRADDPLLDRARRAGAALTTEVELFLERAANPVCAVTGTHGKSSTVRMTADLLAAAGLPARAGGNLGGSLLDALDALDPREVCVLELSSYQLEHLGRPAPRMRAVAVTNLSADHLERHGTPAAYAAAKRRILDGLAPDGVALLPDEPPLADWRPPRGERVDVRRGATEGGLFVGARVFRWDEEELGRVADLALPGRFQAENALVALGLARALGAAPERLAAALPRLRGLPHRLERLGRFAGREVIDNGVSTTPETTLAALREVGRGATLLVGGQAKRGLTLAPLVRAAAELDARVVAFGAAGPELARAFRAGGVEARRAADVAEAARAALGAPGGAVLFSPACASFDAHANFRERALAFRAALPDPDPDGPAPS